ncbi:MAG: rod shape-determining protein RodA [Oligoflexales bacterium]
MTTNHIHPKIHSNLLSITVVFLLLMAIALANLYSTGSEAGLFDAQLKRAILGTVVFFGLGWLLPVQKLSEYAYFSYIITILCLFAVLCLGHTAGGAQRWLSLGFIKIQPSEFAKITLVIATARFFQDNKNLHTFRLSDLSPAIFLSMMVFILIFKQPDFGTAGICLMVVAAQVAMLRVHLTRQMLFRMFIGGIGTMIIGWMFLLMPYQKIRILNLLDPQRDPSGSGYSSLQSLVAIGSGGLSGKGYLQGTQTQLQFLPARHTDFIFAAFSEEHGFMGGTFVFALFAALILLMLDVAKNAKDIFNSLLTVGLAALIFSEFVINVLMVLGLFPVVGMPLPFFSYGGSSLLTICIACGLIVAIERERLSKLRNHRQG